MTSGDEKFPKCKKHGTPMYYHGGRWHCTRCYHAEPEKKETEKKSKINEWAEDTWK